ncbi:hypothetical protein NEF87_003708 [Candidatus Lokiarchaeum ossiferum]|uniref:Histidine kinase N-terminal 7TM region domain-containing protein n=1 Tax=Candidatus Lokiarchaeum ossiferum TaxID=2951803 RepID=A0ABY6HV78_9ARCH|nr:hypothetical protein NEF87_003708 [Candidatus Lokiarchaeum sp. B-35]
MAVSIVTILNGGSALALVLIGGIFATIYFKMYFEEKRKLLPLVGFAAFSMGTFYLGPAISFISLMFNGENLDPELYFKFSYVFIPIATVVVLYLGFSVFQPKYRIPITILYSILCIDYWVAMFFYTDMMFSAEVPLPGQLLDINLEHIIKYQTAFYILSLIFVISGGFFWMRRKLVSQNSEAKEIKKITQLAFGWAFFGLGAIMDSILPTDLLKYVIFARIIMGAGYILIFLGFMPSKKEA